MNYVYVCHLSSEATVTQEEKSLDDLYCDTCGDADYLYKEFESVEEANEFVENYNRELKEKRARLEERKKKLKD